MVDNIKNEVPVFFDGSFDGFLSIVYAVYYDKIAPLSIQTENGAQLSLLIEPYFVETDFDKAAKVYKGIKRKISSEAAGTVYNAFLSFEESKFMTILKYIKLGFKVGHMVDSHLQQDFVRDIRKMAGHVGREAHLLTGFCRFAETKQGVLYSPVTPKNDVLGILAEHFKERLMNEQWVIHDKRRNKAAIYDGEGYVIAATPKDAVVNYADGEEQVQELWVAFFNTLAIKERSNKKLQRQLLPLYFRKNMTEFQL